MAPTRRGAAFVSLLWGGKSVMHEQIVSGLYTTLVNLSPVAYRERRKQKNRKNKERGIQAIITTPLHRHLEGYEPLTKEPLMKGILKPGWFRSRRLPSHPLFGRRCTQMPAAPTWTLAQGSKTR
jgi:hypothetical protein